jgi:hypothetical protein
VRPRSKRMREPARGLVLGCALVLGLTTSALAGLSGCRSPAPRSRNECMAPRGVCADAGERGAPAGLPRCGLEIGDWRVERPRASDADEPGLSGFTCLRSPAADRGRGALGDAIVIMAPQPPSVPGETLVSLRAGRHARLTLSQNAGLPDHWAVALAGRFLDVDTVVSGCSALGHRPVNAGYAVIGANWGARPHGFYFERLIDACVYDGAKRACGGAAPFIAHEFQADETFQVDLALEAGASGWALSAVLRERAGNAWQELGALRRSVDAPCWLEPGDPGHALVVVIPNPSGNRDPRAHVGISDLTWLD